MACCMMMKSSLTALVLSAVALGTFPLTGGTDGVLAGPPAESHEEAVKSVLGFTMKDIDGKEVNLAEAYKGKVVLIVNTASKCGLTPQYKALEALYQAYKSEGLVILGFPCNDFNGQEPGSETEIKKFCTTEYSVTFPMFSKVTVKAPKEGSNDPVQSPLYGFLTSKETNPKFAGDIAWNFTKFLVDREGNVVARFEPKTKPDAEEVVKAVKTALAKK